MATQMAHRCNIKNWSNFRLWGIISLGAAFLLDIAVLVCAGIWAADRRRDYEESFRQQPSNGQLIFYSFTAPFITFFFIPTKLGFMAKGLLSPVISLMLSIVMMCGWIVQISFWFYCEASSESIMEMIPLWCPNAKESIVGDAKAYIGLFIAVAFCAVLCLSAAAVHRNRKSWSSQGVLNKTSSEVNEI